MNSIEQSIIDIISQYSLKKHILINDSFEDIGLDSVDFVMLFFDIEKYLSIFIDETDLEFNTINDLIIYVTSIYTSQKNKDKIN